jgi:maltooligosyltrehalose trehalohydrolase
LRHTEPDLADPWLDHLGVDYGEDRRWIVMHRGSLAVVCNAGPNPVAVPYTGEVVLAWGQPEARDDSTVLAGHSFAILRAPPPDAGEP